MRLFASIVNSQHSCSPHNIWRSLVFCACGSAKWNAEMEEEREEGGAGTSEGWFSGGGALLEQQQPCHCRFTSGLPHVLLAERSHGWIGVSQASSAASRPSLYLSFPQTNKLSTLCVPSHIYHLSSWPLPSNCSFSHLSPSTSLNTPPHLMHLLWVLPHSVPVRGKGQGAIWN